MEEQEEVNTTLFRLLDFEHDLSTFNVPFIQGSIKVACVTLSTYKYN